MKSLCYALFTFLYIGTAVSTSNATDKFNLCLLNASSAKKVKIEYGKVVSENNEQSPIAENMLIPFAAKEISKKFKVNFDVLRNESKQIANCYAGENLNSDRIPFYYVYEVNKFKTRFGFEKISAAIKITIPTQYSPCKKAILFSGVADVSPKKGELDSAAESRAVTNIITGDSAFFNLSGAKNYDIQFFSNCNN